MYGILVIIGLIGIVSWKAGLVVSVIAVILFVDL